MNFSFEWKKSVNYCAPLVDKMSKRKRQYEEDSYQQLKTHVGPKEIACNSPVHMNEVYGTYDWTATGKMRM